MTEHCNCLYPCPNCPNRSGPQVGSKGKIDSPLIIIGESPGKQELKEKAPFVGPSGKLLQAAIDQHLGFEPYFINAMQCWPGNRDDKDDESMIAAVQTCRHHVIDEIRKHPRKMILALGAPALWSVMDRYDLRITQQRGRLLPTDLAEIGCVASVHPAFLMAGGAGATPQQFFRDVEYAISLAKGGPRKQPPEINYYVAQNRDDIYDFASTIHHVESVAADVETSGFSSLDDRMLCAGFAWHANSVFVVPKHLLPYCKVIFQAPCRFGWHNGKFDVKFFWNMGVSNARVDDDTMLLSYCLDEIGGIHDLETVASDWLDAPNWKDMLDSYLPSKSSSYEVIPVDILHKYMAFDVGDTRALLDILRPKVMRDAHLRKLYTRTLIPASHYLARVESRGIYVDLAAVQRNEEIYKAEIEKHGKALVEYANQFPDAGFTDKLPNSPKQLTKLLYECLKFKPYKNKKTTDRKVLEHLGPHPVLTLLGRYRKVAKERGTYITPLLGRAKQKGKVARPSIIRSDNRVHATYLLHGTRTGRLASRDPNLQNVPRNPIIRGQYIASPGRRLIEPDLNQAELRVLATFSRDPELCRIYLTKGMSLHDEVRAELYGYPKDWSPKQVEEYLRKFSLQPDQRFDENGKDLLVAEQKMRAKNVNFGIPYGITSVGLAEQCDCLPAEAQVMLDQWAKKFPAASETLKGFRDAPLKGQTLITPFGRKKRPGVVSQEMLQAVQNESANFPMQSVASDITIQAGMEVEDRLREEFDTYCINLIHDALLLDAPDDDAICAEVTSIVTSKMTEIPIKWGLNVVPFVAEAKQGYRWGSLKG
jgi:uracil-DNA glycosylase family 4